MVAAPVCTCVSDAHTECEGGRHDRGWSVVWCGEHCVATRINTMQHTDHATRVAVSRTSVYRERKCADTTGTVLVPWAGQWPFPVLKYKYTFQMKYKEAILLHSTRKLLRLEI